MTAINRLTAGQSRLNQAEGERRLCGFGKAIVAIGANLGDPISAARGAAEALEAYAVGPVLRSSLWQSDPLDCPPGSPVFVNAVVTFETNVAPMTLLGLMQGLERQAGRHPGRVKNAPRELDLDLIAVGPLQVKTETLELPHPRAPERAFVLRPLAELCPRLVLPGQTQSVSALCRVLPGQGVVLLSPWPWVGGGGL